MNFPKNKNLDMLGDGGAFSEKTRQSADLAIERERHVTSRHVTLRHVRPQLFKGCMVISSS